MKSEMHPEGEFNAQPRAAQGFVCCCPIVIPLLPFFALRWAVMKITGPGDAGRGK